MCCKLLFWISLSTGKNNKPEPANMSKAITNKIKQILPHLSLISSITLNVSF